MFPHPSTIHSLSKRKETQVTMTPTLHLYRQLGDIDAQQMKPNHSDPNRSDRIQS